MADQREKYLGIWKVDLMEKHLEGPGRDGEELGVLEGWSEGVLDGWSDGEPLGVLEG